MAVRERLLSKPVKRLAVRILPKKWFCNLYDHSYLVDVNRPKNSPSVDHSLYCGHCRAVFGNMTFPFMAYKVRTVNKQYSMSLEKWFNDVGLRGSVADSLIGQLQKFRHENTKAIRDSGQRNGKTIVIR